MVLDAAQQGAGDGQGAQGSGAGLMAAVRPEARSAPGSGIIEVMSRGRGRQGLIPLWVGESDLPTPGFICEAAARSLKEGETFYTWQAGLPELREALARYQEGLYGAPYAGSGAFGPERFFVTGSGMQAVQIAVRLAAGEGDEVLVPTPAWPNFAAAVGVGGARPVPVPMTLGDGRWLLDIERLRAAVTPRTRALVINSPANPTGWTAGREELSAILDLARGLGLWIIADEIYARFVYDGSARAPSFHDVMEEGDRVLFVQTFSKNWAMTGWRVGWIEAPAELGDTIENLIQYSTSGVAAFMQRAAVAALEGGEAFIGKQVALCARNRARLLAAFAADPRLECADVAGAFYAFFRIEGVSDTRALALSLVDETGVGLAPGTAFGPGGAPYLRLCFARRTDEVDEAAARLLAWMERAA